MKSRKIDFAAAFLTTAFLVAISPPATALDIRFDYRFDDNNFFVDQSRRDVLQAAGDFWGNRIVDNMTAAISTTPGVESYNIDIRHPSTGVLGFGAGLENFSVQEDEFVIFVGARDLGGSTVGVGGFGGFGNIFGDAAYIANVRTRGQTGVSDSPPTDFQRWGGWISFDNRASTDWFFDSSPTSFDSDDFQGAETDFFTFALHEVGHVLGISDSNGSWTNNNPFNVAPDGSHLTQGTLSPGGLLGQTEALMVNIVATSGQRKLPTVIDFEALTKIGWEVPGVFQTDFNGNGTVDAADYTVWRDSEGATGPGLAADANGDNIVNQVDYDLWVINFGAASAVGVPEPSSVGLTGLLLFALGCKRPLRGSTRSQQ